MITAVKTRRLLDVDIHPDFRTLMEHKAFLSTWCRTFMFTREKEVFFPLKIFLAPPTQEGSFEVMFVATHHTQEQQELKTCESESQNATRKKEVCSHRLMHSISLASDVHFVRILCLCMAS